MKRILICLFCLQFLVCGCKSGNVTVSDGEVLKKEYEKYNGNSSISVYVDDTSIFKIIDKDEIKNISNGVVFIGKSDNVESRAALSVLLKSINSTALSKLYYVYFDDELDVGVDIDKCGVLFIKDGEVVDSHIGVLESFGSELSSEDEISLYGIYLEGIHKILNDQCDDNKTSEEKC